MNHTIDEITEVGKDDPILTNKLIQTSTDNVVIKTSLEEIDDDVKSMRKKKEDCQAYITLIENKPEKFSF